MPFGYRAVHKILEMRHKLTTDDYHGILKMQSSIPQVVPAQKTAVLDALLICPLLQGEKEVIQHPTSFSLPGGLIVKSSLFDLPPVQPASLPVVITNESDHDIVIPARVAIAESQYHPNHSSQRAECASTFPEF